MGSLLTNEELCALAGCLVVLLLERLGQTRLTAWLVLLTVTVEVHVGFATSFNTGDAGRVVDLLLTDVMMPTMTGPELARRVRQLRPELPILFMSGYVEDVFESEQIDTSTDVIFKPFSAEDLVRRVRRKLEESQTTPRTRAARPDSCS